MRAVIASALALLICASATAGQTPKPRRRRLRNSQGYALQAGDELQISVLGGSKRQQANDRRARWHDFVAPGWTSKSSRKNNTGTRKRIIQALK